MEEELMQYSVDVTPTLTAEGIAAMGAFAGIYMLFWLIVLVVSVVAMWKIFVKAGQPGWASLIPFYNLYVMLKMVGRPGWWLILMLIPFVNFVVFIVLSIDLAKSFGQSAVFGVVMLFLFSLIGYLVLAFSNDMKYIGPGGVASSGGNATPPTNPEPAAPAVS